MTGRVRVTVAALVAAYGAVMMIVNARNGLLPTTYTRDWVLVGGSTDFPGDFGRNVFAGSIGLGLLFLIVAVAVAVTAGRAAARIVGAVALLVALVLLVLYDDRGNLLGAKPSSAAVLAAVGLFLIASPLLSQEPADSRAGASSS